MATVKSGINKVGNNYYQSITQDNPDGSVGTTFYRVNADGSGGVPIYDVDKSADSTSPVKSFDSNATAEERRLLSDPNSQLSQVRSQQVTSSNPYSTPNQQVAGGGSGNVANTGESIPQQEGGSSSSSPSQQTSKPAPSSLIYPINMRSDQDRIKFTAVTYAATGNLNSGSLSPQNRKTPRSSTGPVVFLPVQASIQDFNSVDWQSDTLNPMQQQVVNLSSGVINSGGDVTAAVDQEIGKAFENLGKSNKEIKIAAAGAAAGVQNLLGRYGAVLNPNLELLFAGPQLRPFSFTFRLSAREQDEANNIKQIINFFKKNMAAKQDSSRLFLRSPNTFFIEYLFKGNQKHPGINQIKECALTSCSVDYTPNQTYMTFEDGTMVSYTVSLTFQELEPIYDVDYEDGHPIGY